MATRTDLFVHEHGSTFVLCAVSRRGRASIHHEVTADRMESAGAFVVEHRFIVDIFCGAIADGLRVA